LPTTKQSVRSVLGRLRRRFQPLKVTTGEDPSVQILHGVKLYREVHIGGTIFRGTADTSGRTIGYVFDLLPTGAVTGKTVLDLGTAGGAVCFEAVERGARLAVGVETEDRRIRGARFIKRRTRLKNVEFVQQDFWEFFQRTRPEFDLILVLNVLHHLANPRPLLRRIAKAARERIVVEIPTTIDVERYNEYSADLVALQGEGPLQSPDDVTRFLALYDFALERQRPSPPETQFYGHDEAARALYVYSRLSAAHVKSREERWMEVEPYRAARNASWQQARADPFNIDCLPGDRLDDILRQAFDREWTNGELNVLLCAPAAAGKSHLFERASPATHPPYNYKVFKFPNDKSQQGLHRHLNPRQGEAGRIGQVLLNTVDDLSSHCAPEALARAISGKPVVCLLLNVGFDEHFARLYRRQVERVGTVDAAVDYEVPLQFDCTKVIEQLRQHRCRYRVLTLIPDADRG
jgi:2-polyprenyl-3-methyl-5-hydroxy-6-metoxy-1,4-benzoquinol methylase